MISFQNIPAGLRVPLFYAELDPSQANTAAETQRTLIIAQVLATGTIVPNAPVLCTSYAQARLLGGPGSTLPDMYAAYRANDPTGEIWVVGVVDDPTAVKATGGFYFNHTAGGSGTITGYIAGQKVTVAVSAGDSPAVQAAAMVAAINANADLPLTAVLNADAKHVDCTAKHAGAVGNGIDIRVNYLGAAAGEVLPYGATVVVGQMSGGATNPSLTTALASLSGKAFDFIVSPFTDLASLTAIGSFLSDTTGRWSPLQQTFGHQFTSARGTQGQLATLGATVNDQHLSIMGAPNSPSSPWVWAAGLAGAAAVSLRNDPALPLQSLVIAGVLPPVFSDAFTLQQRNALLYDGISTFRVEAGAVYIENLITTYTVNAQGEADNSYLEVETPFTLMAVIRRLRSTVTSKFARVKLAADGVRPPPGSRIVTPSTIKAELIACYRQMEQEDGWAQQSDVFAANLVVEKDANTPGRVNVLFPAVLIEQLRIFASLIQFRLF